ncbi:hypothetical protein K438DRAFT_1610668 [Mycena galopus ATCC 62051]|nr:hypothetical protein K438DRAFT_1610668 [Mycena galopus ATCC 62051]
MNSIYYDTKLYNIALTAKKELEQLVSSVYEDMDVVKVEYSLDQGRITSSTPTVLSSQTLFNTTDIEQEIDCTMKRKVTETTSFSHTEGISLPVGTSFSAGVPWFNELDGFHVNPEFGTSMTWGQESNSQQSFSTSFTVKAAPHSSVLAVWTVDYRTLEIPYTTTLRSRSTGTTATSSGIWRGPSTTNQRVKNWPVAPGEVA